MKCVCKWYAVYAVDMSGTGRLYGMLFCTVFRSCSCSSSSCSTVVPSSIQHTFLTSECQLSVLPHLIILQLTDLLV